MKTPIMLLQEYTQKAKLPFPEYSFVEIKDKHPFQYQCTCIVSALDKTLNFTASSKQKAKTATAKLGIIKLTELGLLTQSKTNQDKILVKSTSVNTNNKQIPRTENKPVIIVKQKLNHDWYNALLVYAAQTNKEYRSFTSVTDSGVEATATFDNETHTLISNNKRNAQLLVAKIFFDKLGLIHVERVDVSQIHAEIKQALPLCKCRITGDVVEIVTSEALNPLKQEKMSNTLLQEFTGIKLNYYSNQGKLLPPSTKPNAAKIINEFDQNFTATVIKDLAPASFKVRKISWYLESKTVVVHIQPLDENASINNDIQKFKDQINHQYDLLVLINRKRRSYLALQALKEITNDGWVDKTAVKTISTGNYYTKTDYPEPQIKSKGRVDHRDQHTFTIDSDSSIDLDDAFAVEIQPDGIILYVHIADVAALLPENSTADIKALHQGFTYYGISKQLPMIPEELMFLASLLPMKDRLSWTVKMEINNECEVTEYRIYRSIVRSKFRLSQKQVVQTIDNKADVTSIVLKKMAQISIKLKQYRLDDGGLSNINDENLGYQLVQEFMLLANRCVAEFCLERKLAIPYRYHAFPDNSEEFKQMYNESKPEMQGALMPYLGKASYSVDKTSHAALSFAAYCHFTSPIRRYADLALQRQLSRLFNNEKIKTSKEVGITVEKINQATQEAELQQGKMIYLEIVLKQFDQCKKPMVGIVTETHDSQVILKSDNQKCSFHLEMDNSNDFQVGDQVKIKQQERFNAHSERFKCSAL